MHKAYANGANAHANVVARNGFEGSGLGVVVSEGIDYKVGILVCQLFCNCVNKNEKVACGTACFNIVGVVGVLQFEVLEYRLKHEYNVDIKMDRLPFRYVRWIENKDIMIFIADYLVKHEIMDREQFELCFTEGVTEEMLDEVKERKKVAADEENKNRREELNNKKQPETSFEVPKSTNDNADDADDAFSDDILK